MVEPSQMHDAARDNEMAADTGAATSSRLEAYEARTRVPMIILSLVFVVILLLEARLPDGRAFTVLLAIDLAIWAVFVVDYIYRLHLAERRLAYALQALNLVDFFVVLLPVFMLLGASFLGLARLGRLLRLFGFLRAGGLVAGNARRAAIFLTRPSNAKIALSLGLLLSVIAAVGVWAIERRHPEATVDSWIDTLWWGLATVTTVGYGDVSPQSTAGRLIAIVVMVAGIASFGWVTALLTSHFVDVRKAEDDTALQEELLGIAARLERLEELLARQLAERSTTALSTSWPGHEQDDDMS